MLASMPFTVTRDLILPSTVTGSWPRPRWFDTSMWGKPLDTCMLDVRFREKFEDALAVVISDEERAGLDILTHGDFHCDEDFAGRKGFTFTVLDPADRDVIGCVYLYPPEREGDVIVQSWVRADRAELDEPLADAVAAWLADEWPWENPDRCGR